MFVCMYVCMYVLCIFIELHIIAQSGPVILVILCHSRRSMIHVINTYVCMYLCMYVRVSLLILHTHDESSVA